LTLRFPVAGQRKVRTTVIIKRHVCSRGNFPYSSNDGNEILILPLRFGRAFGMCPRNCPRQTALNFKTGRLNTRCGVARCARAAWIPSGAKLEVTGRDGTAMVTEGYSEFKRKPVGNQEFRGQLQRGTSEEKTKTEERTTNTDTRKTTRETRRAGKKLRQTALPIFGTHKTVIRAFYPPR